MKQDKYKIVCFDVETTGVDAMTCRPTEFGAVIQNVDKSTTEVSFLIKNKEFSEGVYDKLTPIVTQITGITDDMLKDEGLEMQDAMDKVAEVFGLANPNPDVRTIIVAHNLFGYDLKVIKRYLEECGYKFEVKNDDLFDTGMEYKAILIKSVPKDGETISEHQQRIVGRIIKGWNLKSTAEYYKIPFNENAHRALNDARPTMGIFQAQVRDIKKRKLLLEKLKENKPVDQQEFKFN